MNQRKHPCRKDSGHEELTFSAGSNVLPQRFNVIFAPKDFFRSLWLEFQGWNTLCCVRY